jgi:3-phenylpropionate/trans-cinnamate dioxygenase ferredoxin subunit
LRRSRTGYTICPLAELPPGSTRIVEVAGREIGLFNVNGQVYAVRNSCPHRAAPLCLGRLSGTTLPSEPYQYLYGHDGLVLRCPWHGWEFDLASGEPLVGHGLRATTYPVVIVDDQIVLMV